MRQLACGLSVRPDVSNRRRDAPVSLHLNLLARASGDTYGNEGLGAALNSATCTQVMKAIGARHADSIFDAALCEHGTHRTNTLQQCAPRFGFVRHCSSRMIIPRLPSSSRRTRAAISGN